MNRKRSRCPSRHRPRRPVGGVVARSPASEGLASAVWQASFAAEILTDAQDALFAVQRPRERMRRAVRLLGSLTLPAGRRVEHAMREFSLAFREECCPGWAAEQVARIRSLAERTGGHATSDACAVELSIEELSQLADAFFELYDLVCQADG